MSRAFPFVVAALCLVLTACDHYAAQAAPSLTPIPNIAPRPTPSGCADPSVRDPVVAVEGLSDPSGCVPLSEAVVYRCEPALDPVLVLDAGGNRPRVFLGGAFAVPAVPPDDARAVGATTIGRVMDVPTDPRLAYVEAAGTTERWLELPASRLEGPPTAFLLGDSILDGASTAISSDPAMGPWELTVDGVVGRSSSGGVTPAESLVSVPDVAVIELGVNDHDVDVFRANEQRMVDALDGAGLVVLVTPHGPESVTSEIDRAVGEIASTVPNAAVADWDRAVPLDALSSDGVHLDTGNEGVFADFLDPFLTRWREAVDGAGATACGPAVLNAAR